MGRPKLYHSAEERLAANRAKSLRSYHKRKFECNARRRANYKARANSERRDLAFWTKKAECIADQHRAVVGDTPFNYLDNLYHDYSITHCKLGLQTAADTHDTLAQALVNAQNAILNIDGVDDAFRRTEEIIRRIRSINSYISDVLCDCMADPNSVELKHQSQEFEYQRWLQGRQYVDL
ncbi:hypothetical protein H0H92_004407 [Tricholoma furcatifolium]|nr:hypothetical protein H0H92_004407 [Tricholoma furcatifolium]